MKIKKIDRIRIGIDISQLVHTHYLAGPQRVLLATLNSLLRISKEKNIELLGINLSGKSTTSNLEVIITNPILKKTCYEISNLDVLFLMDSNNHYAINEIN